MQKDLAELKDTFLRSDYPQRLVEKYIKLAISKVKTPCLMAQQKKLYLGINYFNEKSEFFSKQLARIVSKYLGFVKIIPFFKKGKSLLSLFSKK